MFTSLYHSMLQGDQSILNGGGETICEQSVRRGLGRWPTNGELQGGSAPLPKKILYLMDIRYIISFPSLVKNCLIFTPN